MKATPISTFSKSLKSPCLVLFVWWSSSFILPSHCTSNHRTHPAETGLILKMDEDCWRWFDMFWYQFVRWLPQLISNVKPKLIEILNVDLLPQWINKFLLFWKLVTSYRSWHHTVPGTWVVFNDSPPCAWMRQHYPLTRCERTGNLGPLCLVVKKFQESGDTKVVSLACSAGVE